MRPIDADKLKQQIAAVAVDEGTVLAAKKAGIMLKLIDSQPTVGKYEEDI